jgi:O-antigen ligase
MVATGSRKPMAPSVRSLALSLLLILLSFAFLAAEPAQALGLQTARTIGFPLVLLALATLAVAHRPAVPVPHHAGPLLLLGLIGLIAVQSLARTFDPMALKIALPVLALLMAPRLALLLEGADAARAVRSLLAGYVAVTVLMLLLGGADDLARGDDGARRWDVTGSVVTHASFCVVYTVLAATTLQSRPDRIEAVIATFGGAAALAMTFLSGTRTALVTWALFLVLALRSGGGQRRVAALAGTVALGLAVHTLLVSDSFAQRLQGGADDYSSGRAHSLAAWLGRLAEQPLGIGLGGVRTALAEERPAIDGERMLEWPHNEIVRLTVEGGPLGLVLVVGLIACTLRLALRGAAATADPLRRNLLLVLAADVAAESLLQNFFNGVYQATAFLLLIGLLATPLTARPQPG